MRGKKDFAKKVLAEHQSNDAPLEEYKSLKNEFDTLFRSSAEKRNFLDKIYAEELYEIEQDEILNKSIVGKQDIDLAALIEELKNADWVRQGMQYLQNSRDLCPFCQQQIDEGLRIRLESYFDENYEKNLTYLAEIASSYEQRSSDIEKQINNLIKNPDPSLDVGQMENQSRLLKESYRENLRLLNDKQREPSRSVSLNKTAEILQEINKIIDTANNQIKSYNKMIDDRYRQSEQCRRKVWRYILENLRKEISDYDKYANGISRAIQNLTKK